MRVCYWRGRGAGNRRRMHPKINAKDLMGDAHIQTRTCIIIGVPCGTQTRTRAVVHRRSSISCPSRPVRRSLMFSAQFRLFGLVVMEGGRGGGGSKSRGRVEVRAIACLRRPRRQMACVRSGTGSFNKRTPCWASISFKGKRYCLCLVCDVLHCRILGKVH